MSLTTTVIVSPAAVTVISAGTQGPPGPPGVAGATGPAGATGATGATGPPGTTDHAALTHLDFASAGHTGFVPSARQVIAGVGIVGGGNLSADVTLSLPVLIVAGVYGDTTHYPVLTLDAEGRVTAVSLQGLAPGGVTTFNTRTGDIVLTSADVTTALGFSDFARLGLANTFTVGPQTVQGTVFANALTLSSTVGDVVLNRDAAGILAQRNGANPQTFRLYNTYTDAANGSWLEITAGATHVIQAKANGTGSVGVISIVGNSPAAKLGLDNAVGAYLDWNNTTSQIACQGAGVRFKGTMYANADNVYDIGLSNGTSRPRSVYAAGQLVSGVATGLTAAGTTQGTALALTAVDFHEVTTVAVGTGVVLMTAIAGMRPGVRNAGANALLIYPATGAQIDALGANVGYSLAAGKTVKFYAVSATKWYSHLGA